MRKGQCFSTVLPKAADFEVRIIREEVGQLTYTMFLCDKILSFESKESGEEAFRISKEQIALHCQD